MQKVFHFALITLGLLQVMCQEFVRYPYYYRSRYSPDRLNFPPLHTGYLDFNIKIDFKPEQLDGILILQTTWHHDYFSAITINGTAYFRFNNGHGLEELASLNTVNLNEWNTIEIEKKGRNGSLILNGGSKVTGYTPGTDEILYVNANEQIFVGGHDRPEHSAPMEHAGVGLMFVGCIKKVTADVVDSQGNEEHLSLMDVLTDFDTRDQCYYDVLCDVSGQIEYVSDQKDPLCHWNKNNSPFKLESKILSNCSKSLFDITYDWTFYSLTSAEPNISSSNEVDMGVMMTDEDAVFGYSDTPGSGSLSQGVYGVTLDLNVTSSIDTKTATVTGYFMITCNDVKISAPDCDSSINLLWNLGINMALSSSEHCVQSSSYSEGPMSMVSVELSKYNASLYESAETTTAMTTTVETSTEISYTSTASTAETTTMTETSTGPQYTSTESTEITSLTETSTVTQYTPTESTERISTAKDTTTTEIITPTTEKITKAKGTTTETITQTTDMGVTQKDTAATTTHTILPTEPSLLSYVTAFVTCYSNCESKVSPSKTVKLRAGCRNCSLEEGDTQAKCQDCDDSSLYYTWEYFVCNMDGCITSLISNGSGISEFDASPVTDADSHGQINLTVALDKVSVASSSYTIEVNRAPTMGNCSVSPSTGFALLTTYNITCDGFVDADQPLVYSLYQTSEAGILELMYQSSNQHMESLYLMEGQADMNYTYNLAVTCSDKFGLSTDTEVQVQVLPPDRSESPIDILEISKNLLSADLDLSGTNGTISEEKSKEVIQEMHIITSYLNKESATDESGVNKTAERSKIRDDMVNILTKVKISDLSTVTMTTKVLNEVADVPDELSEENMDDVTDLYGSVAQVLQSQVETLTLSEAETSIGLLLGGMSSLLNHKTEKANKILHVTTTNQTEENLSETKDEVKNSTEKILDNINMVTDSVQDLVPADTEPVVIRTETVDVVVAKVSRAEMIPESLSVTSEEEGSYVTAEVTLPSGSDFFDSISGSSQANVGIQMVVMEKNPYIWDATADDITTPVLSLVLKDDKKETIEVKEILDDQIGIHLANRDAHNNKTVHEVRVVFDYSGDSLNMTNTKQACLALKMITTEERSDILKLEPLGLKIPLKVSINATDTMLYNYSYIISEGTLVTSENNYTFVVPSNYSEEVRISICPYVSEEYMNYYQNLSVQSDECGQASDCTDSYVVAVNISIQTYSAACLYWDTLTEAWSTDGCQVSTRTTPHDIQCFCSHLTAFSGSVFVLPNTVDPFTDAALFLTFFENPVVVMAVVVIWIIYFLLLGWARKADRKDLTKGGVTVLRDNNPNDKSIYLVCVVTGWRRMAGTTANVSISLTGDDGYSTRRCLSDSVSHKQCFSAGSEEWFLITTPTDLGHVHHISVWHDNTGTSPEWFLSRIMIENLQTEEVWTFLYGDWLALDRGSLSARVVLKAFEDENEAYYRKQNLYFKSSRDLRDGHLWISILCKPSYSSFTRVQRLTCALTLLLMTMLTSLMFHGIPLDDPADQVGVGDISFSLADIVIGIQSGLIIFPISIIILQLFIRAGSRPRKRMSSSSTDAGTFNSYSTLSLSSILTMDQNTDDMSVSTENECSQHNLEPKTNVKKLPWWTIYIAWTLALSSSIVSSYFVMLYGLKYGYQKSVDWLISFFTAFFQSAFITQPLKVFGVAIIMTVILKKPIQLEGGKAESNQSKKDYIIGAPKTHFIPDPLTTGEINKIRERLKLEWLTFEKLRDIGLYVIYVCVVLFMVHGQRPVKLSYQCTESLENIFIKPAHEEDDLAFHSIDKTDLFWEYLDVKVVPVLNEMSQYDDDSFTMASSFYLVGPYRLRQLRVQEDTCQLVTDLYQELSAPGKCNGPYQLGDDDDKNYNGNWLLPSSSNGSSIHSEWSYQSSWQLKTIPYMGAHATYGGGGYTVEFDNNVITTGGKLSSLKKQGWIDDRTRAIFIEFTLYNPNVDLFSVVMLLLEFHNTGGIFPFYQIFTTKFSYYTNGLEIFAAVCEGLFLCFTLIFTYIEVQKMRKEGIKVYFTDIWDIVEFIQICLSYSIVGIFFQRLVSVESVLKEYSPLKAFVSFYIAVSWDFILQYLMASLVVLVIIKFFKILKFNKKIFFLSYTLAHGRKDLFNFAIMAFILLSAFSHFSTLVFGPFVSGFRSFGESFMSLINFALGESYYFDFYDASRLFGPAMYLCFFFAANCFLLIMFMSIINFAIRDSKKTLRTMKNELEVIDYILSKISHFWQTKHDKK